MSQLPRDPRQLARDILSGKVKLEDLAREKARQQPMPGGIPPTARVPSPRAPIPQAPPPQQRAIQTAPNRPPAFPQRPPERRPIPPPPRQQPMQQRRQASPPPIPQRPVRAVTQSMQARTAAADQQQHAQNIAQAARTAAARPTPSGRLAIRQMMRNRQSVRTGILLSEILGPPKALRDDF